MLHIHVYMYTYGDSHSNSGMNEWTDKWIKAQNSIF